MISFARPEPLHSLADIQRHARGSLSAAGALETIPVPLADVASAVDLRREDLFSLGKDTPRSVRDIWRRLSGKVLGLLSIPERIIYVDPNLPAERRRFTEAHEIGHDALPWHNQAYFGEDLHTIATDTRELLEREANAFSAELLFGAGRFARESDGYAPGLDVPLGFASQFQASAAAALRYYADHSMHPIALVVTGKFPTVRNAGLHLPVFRAHCGQSKSFTARYGDLHGLIPNELAIAKVPAARVLHDLDRGRGPMTEIVLDTARGRVEFQAETFTNNRLRYMLLHKKSRVEGRKLVLMAQNGLPLW